MKSLEVHLSRVCPTAVKKKVTFSADRAIDSWPPIYQAVKVRIITGWPLYIGLSGTYGQLACMDHGCHCMMIPYTAL